MDVGRSGSTPLVRIPGCSTTLERNRSVHARTRETSARSHSACVSNQSPRSGELVRTSRRSPRRPTPRSSSPALIWNFRPPENGSEGPQTATFLARALFRNFRPCQVPFTSAMLPVLADDRFEAGSRVGLRRFSLPLMTQMKLSRSMCNAPITKIYVPKCTKSIRVSPAPIPCARPCARPIV